MGAQENRLAVLKQFVELLASLSKEQIPTEAEIEAVAKTGVVGSSPNLDVWRPGLDWVLHQRKMGVLDPVSQIASDLLIPQTTTGGPAATKASTKAPRRSGQAHFEALSRWRARGLAEKAPGFAALKDQHLRAIVGSQLRTVDGVAKLLPSAALRARAHEVVEVLAQADAGESPARTPQGVADEPGADERADRGRGVGGAPAPSFPAPVPPSPTTGGGRVRPGRPSGGEAAPTPVAISAESFEAFDLTLPRGEPVLLAAAPNAAGTWTLRWPAPQEHASFVVYRVVSGDDYAPYAPESGALLSVTTERAALDDRPFTTAVRHYQVWRNTGVDQDAAVHSQPTLHASVTVVGQVSRPVVNPDGGRVIGQWETAAGVRRVHVYRIPMEQAARADLSPEYRILSDESNLGGFVDPSVTRGKRYLYLVSVEAVVDGLVQLSQPLRFDVTVPAVLTKVSDLTVTQHQDELRSLDLAWTEPPAGRVAVYRTTSPPRAGAGNEALEASALPQMALREDARLPDPIQRDGQQSRMLQVSWPDGWTRAYFTPVTELDGKVQVGLTTSATFVPPVQLPRLIERVDRQVVTFAWPAGAASVVAFVSARDVPVESARGGRSVEISKRQYEALGGLAFAPPLPDRGCDIHLVPMAFSAGDKIEGRATVVRYPGLLRMRYETSVRRGLMGRSPTLGVEIHTAVDVRPPAFVLVHNATRLPLDISDGAPLEGFDEDDATMATTRRPTPRRIVPGTPSRWRFPVTGVTGFVRLFVDLPPEQLARIALLDPPVAGLRIGPASGRQS